MDEELDIVIIGFEVNDRLAESGLVRVFGLDAQSARRFVRELPVAAKRCSNSATAERYVSALRSIGARVVVKPVREGEGASDRPRPFSSLPIPAPSILAHVDESVRIERETARAIARFRAHEGLDDSQPALDVDPANPRIPKAPLLPHDLTQMPNARLPQFERPDWMLDDPQGIPEDVSDASLPHFDADPPPRPSSAPRPRQSSRPPAKAAPQPLPEQQKLESVPPPKSIGLAHAATASVRPGLGLLASWRPGPVGVVRPRIPRRYWVMAAGLLAAVAALFWLGVFDSAATRRAQSWRAQGVDPGEFAPAAWFDVEGHELRGASRAQLHDLLAKLARAGAPAVYALRIAATEHGQRAEALLIELPQAPDARRTILWHIAEARGRRMPLIPDRRQAYYVLEFQK